MATFAVQTKKPIEVAFRKFHKLNPNVYMAFKGQVYRAIQKKKQKISSKALLNWIRWELQLDIKGKDVYKINDAFTSRYSRLFIKQHPQYAEIFDFRNLRDGSEKYQERPWERNLIDILKTLKQHPNARIVHFRMADSYLLYWYTGPKTTRSKNKTVHFKKSVTNVQFNKLRSKGFLKEVRKQRTNLQHHWTISEAGLTWLKTIK